MVSSNISLAGTNVITSGKVLASAMHTGAVLQVVNATYGTQTSTSSSSFSTTGLSLSITPSSSSSKILALMSCNGYIGAANYLVFTLYRSATNLGDSSWGFGSIYGNTGDRFGQISCSYLDSPATTSSVTYAAYFRVNGSTGYFNLNTGEKSTMTLMEIAA
jgi:hypothetical protein